MAKMLYLCSVIQNKYKMKTSELKKIAAKFGWTIKRHGSKHDLYSHPDYDYLIAIGRHDKEEVKNGTAADTIKKIKGMK